MLMIFDKRKIDNFDTCNVFLSIAANVPQQLKTGFVLQGHTYSKHVIATVWFMCVFQVISWW